jgi:hypothetical protein
MNYGRRTTRAKSTTSPIAVAASYLQAFYTGAGAMRLESYDQYVNAVYTLADALGIAFIEAAEKVHNHIGKSLTV